MKHSLNTRGKIGLILLILSGLYVSTFISCGPSAAESEADRMEISKGTADTTTRFFPIDLYRLRNNEYRIITLEDSCEYIIGWAGYARGGPLGMHKGDCKNPFHKR